MQKGQLAHRRDNVPPVEVATDRPVPHALSASSAPGDQHKRTVPADGTEGEGDPMGNRSSFAQEDRASTRDCWTVLAHGRLIHFNDYRQKPPSPVAYPPRIIGPLPQTPVRLPGSGRLPASRAARVRQILIQRYGYKSGKKRYVVCCWCRTTLRISSFTIEHVIPRKHGGGNQLDNLRPACFTCNNLRGGPLKSL